MDETQATATKISVTWIWNLKKPNLLIFANYVATAVYNWKELF